jgi:hypothetical protein
MKIKIKYKPEFELTLTKQIVELLVKLSNTHYDGACKSAPRQGGLLFRWLNQIEFETPCTATFRELDLTLKIAENRHFLDKSEVILINIYCVKVRNALNKANDYEQD